MMDHLHKQIFNMIGLGKRASKISYGATAITKIAERQAKFVFIASDASENTQKRATNKCINYKVTYNIDFDTDFISQAVGNHNIKVLSINDNNFAKKIKSLLTDLENLKIEQ